MELRVVLDLYLLAIIYVLCPRCVLEFPSSTVAE
jgi:hypothetical protein